ncbi:glycosyltransferase [Amylibacter sp. SFDW26]|uniref:glycosyltransferase family 2 protein n=1 Tax=Amylibacter sp. SFDW26 TaxID=2652722 RepID=UPI0012614C24|nr:glycosyltransferase [Amylibacter sp. SFDW26]KAB7614548.1 glycosyltransferase [Amylibacter sp. SFDW26]
MYEPKISVVVVSRDRPDGLARLLTSLRFQFYKNFEVIVVCNTHDFDIERVKYVHFDEPNISAARNLGIEAAAGDLIAFCDDDAVPEPTWLEMLITPFDDQKIGVAGGFVRGRNGIDFQWKAQQVDCFGNDKPLELGTDADFSVVQADKGHAPKVQGTNCMFRKSMLVALGGFDEEFQFYLDETDVCVRASQAGWQTAIVPKAEVQHGFEESDRRTVNRVPKSLFAEGKSKAHYCKKHVNDYNPESVYKTFEAEQRKRLLKLLVDGLIEPKDIKVLLRTLRMGFTEGQKRLVCNDQKEIRHTNDEFLEFVNEWDNDLRGEAFVGSHISKKQMIQCAMDLASKGIPCTLLYWSFTALFHHRFFDERGFWVQTGGLFGKSDRAQSIFKFNRIFSRGLSEILFLKKFRKIEKISFFRFKRVLKVTKITRNNTKEA